LRSSSRSPLLGGLALTLAAALTACGFTGGGGSGSGGEDDERRIVVDNFRAPLADWSLASDSAYILSIAGCLETLTRWDAAAGEVQPWLATGWEQSSPTTWDVTLRDDVRFQDGTAMDADAVVTALSAALEAEVPARSFNPTTVSGVEALDERTVRVTTPQESPLLPYRLASVNAGVLAPAAYDGATVDPFGHCTGPFEPVSESTGQSLTLDASDDYWGGEVKAPGAEIRFITDGAARATQVRTGEADISLSIPATQLAALQDDPAVEVVQSDSPRTATLYLNNGRAPFDDVDVRRAVRSALDLDALAASVYEGAAEPSAGVFAPSEPWAVPGATVPQQDVEEAKALLADAGYTADRPLEIIAIVERAEFADVAAVVQESLAAVGMPVEITTGEAASIEPRVLSGDYDMLLSQRNRLIDIADPIGFLTADYSCEGTYNLSHFCDPAYDALLEQAATTDDQAARYALYAEAGRLLDEQAVNVWLVNERATNAVGADVQGFTQDPLSRYVLTAETTTAGP
jgi:peptide/nickel transport system substrate-binding protein